MVRLLGIGELRVEVFRSCNRIVLQQPAYLYRLGNQLLAGIQDMVSQQNVTVDMGLGPGMLGAIELGQAYVQF